LLVWYENEAYTDNEVENYLTDYPSYGPKGRMLVIDSQPGPYRSPFLDQPTRYPNEGANLEHRSLMRDAPFTLAPTVDFDFANTALYPSGSGVTTTHFTGRTAVNIFHDALGYYPGAEFVRRSPAQTSRWVTKQWDASTVVPSQSFYALNAPGYDGFHTGSTANEFRYNCAINTAGLLGCYFYGGGTGLGYYGGNGNPADEDGQYGWHVELVDEAGDHTWGKVRIWNSPYAADSVLTPDASTYDVGDTINYMAQFKNGGSKMSYLACASFDTSLVEYVPGSATGGALELASCPTGTLLPDTLAPTAGTVGALAWTINNADPGVKSTLFNFQLKANQVGFTHAEAEIYRYGGDKLDYTALTSPEVLITSDYAIDSMLTPSATDVKTGEIVGYTADFKNIGELSMNYLACVSIDTSLFEYVADSASGTPMLLASCPTGALAPESATSSVGALAWSVNSSTPGSTASFTFDVKALAPGVTAAEADAIKTGGGSVALLKYSPSVTISYWFAFLPSVSK